MGLAGIPNFRCSEFGPSSDCDSTSSPRSTSRYLWDGCVTSVRLTEDGCAALNLPLSIVTEQFQFVPPRTNSGRELTSDRFAFASRFAPPPSPLAPRASHLRALPVLGRRGIRVFPLQFLPAPLLRLEPPEAPDDLGVAGFYALDGGLRVGTASRRWSPPKHPMTKVLSARLRRKPFEMQAQRLALLRSGH